MKHWTLDEDYHVLIEDVLDNGVNRTGRNGGFTSRFGEVLKHDLRCGFPIITTRKIAWRQAFGELAAFLEGATSLARFKELGCTYWEMNSNGKDDLGPIYGAQWRNFGGVDQLQQLLEGLQKNPTSRRHVMSTWNPADLEAMCLPPCHLLTQFHVAKGLLHQTVYMRSVDLCLGLPYDLVLYGLLQHLVAHEVGLEPAEMTFMLGDAHVYDAHDELWQIQKYRSFASAPPVLATVMGVNLLDFQPGDATFINYEPHEAIDYALL